MSEKRKFLKNNLYILINKVVSKLITFLVIVYAARESSKEVFGVFIILVLLSGIVVTLHDFGSSLSLVRSIAKDSSNSQNLFFITIIGKFLLAPLVIVIFLLIPDVISIGKDLESFVYLYAISTLSQSFLLTSVKYYEGKENMLMSSILIVAERSMTLLLFFLIINHVNLINAYAYSIIISNGIIFIINSYLVFRLRRISKFIKFADLKNIFISSKVFWFFTIISIIYNKFDVFYIAEVFDSLSVASYRANYQLVDSIYFLPLNLSVSFLPFFSRLFASQKTLLRSAYSQIGKQFLLFSMFIFITISLKADLIISLLYSKYLDSYLILAVLGFSIPLFFFNSLNGNMLIAMGKERLVTSSMIITALLKVVLITLTAKTYGVMGIAVIVVICEFVAFLIQNKAVRYNSVSIKYNSKDLKLTFSLFIYAFLLIIVKSEAIIILIICSLLLYYTWHFVELVKKMMKEK